MEPWLPDVENASGVLGPPTRLQGRAPMQFQENDTQLRINTFQQRFFGYEHYHSLSLSYEFDLAGKGCGVVFSPNLHIPSKSDHWIWRATLAGCKNASLLRPGTPCPQGTWSERGGITSVLDCKNCDERREMGPIGFVRSPMVDYLRSLRQNPYQVVYLDLPQGDEWMIKGALYTIPQGSKSTFWKVLVCIFIQHTAYIQIYIFAQNIALFARIFFFQVRFCVLHHLFSFRR